MARGRPRHRLSLPRVLDGATHSAVIAFALWTLVYDIGLASHSSTSVLVAIWAGCVVGTASATAWLAVRRASRRAGLAAAQAEGTGHLAITAEQAAAAAPANGTGREDVAGSADFAGPADFAAPGGSAGPAQQRARAPIGSAAAASSSRSSRPVSRFLAAFGIAAGCGAGTTAMLTGRGWVWDWTVGLGAAAVVAALAWLIVTRAAAMALQARRPFAAPQPASLTESLLALCVAVGAAVASLYIVRPNGDDAYYVSRSVWVAQHGTIPSKDIVFTNQMVPHIWGEPPISSIEVLIGALARLTGGAAGAATYLVALPILTFFAVWAVWMLIRRWAPRRYLLCFGVAMVYLAWGGGSAGSYGAFHLVRMWQGKAAFVSVVVPLLYVYLTDWLERRSWQSLGLVFAVGVAGAGLSSAAVYIMPFIVVAAAAPVLFVGRVKIALGAGVGAVYVVAAGLVVAALSPLSPLQAVAVQPAQVWQGVLAPGVFGALAGVAVWTAPWLVRRGVPAVIATGIALVALVLILPGLLTLLGDKTNAGPVMYRTFWALPVPVLIGMLAAIPLAPARFEAVARWVAPVPAAAVAAALILSGVPLVSPPLTSLASHPAWKYDPAALAMASRVLGADHRIGDILAPWQVMAAMPRLTTLVHAVDAREYYLTAGGLPASAQFIADRLLLTRLADGARPFPAEAAIRAAMSRVGVGYACTEAANTGGLRRIERAGFTPAVSLGTLQCLDRSAAGLGGPDDVAKRRIRTAPAVGQRNTHIR
jgi:Family of unknown function (DUF6077)